MIYLVINDAFDEEGSSLILYATDDLEKASNVLKQLENMVKNSLTPFEDFLPDNCWDVIDEIGYEEFKDLFYENLTENIRENIKDAGYNISDELLYNTWLISHLPILSLEFSIIEIPFNEDFHSVEELFNNAIKMF